MGRALHSDENRKRKTEEIFGGFLSGAGTDLLICTDPRHDGPVLQQLEIEIPVGRVHLKMVHTDV